MSRGVTRTGSGRHTADKIKQEKIKMYEERKKMNQLNAEEREIMKNKLKEMLNSKKINSKNINNIEIDENLINNIIYN